MKHVVPGIVAGLSLAGQAVAGMSKPPNILFILTDDQDWHMESMAHMPFLHKHLINEGTVYSNHYCTVALCCPSRVNMWTGQAAHNTNVTDVWAPYGGYPKVVREGINDNYLPTWLQDAGYNTYYSGKLWNQHSVENYNKPYDGGFNASDFLLDPYTYQYYNPVMTRNGAFPVHYKGEYSPDLTADKAYSFLREAMSHDKPWFVVHAPIACRGDVKLLDKVVQDKPGVAKRHEHLFKDYKIPRDEYFNPEEQGGVSWVKRLTRLNDTVIEYNDEFARSRLRSLQSVDEMVENMIKILDEAGELDNTYIFYTTDHGYHISQHRMHPGKECGFETDVHIPLIVRGPGVPIGHVSNAVASHTDIASTIMELAGAPIDSDGTPIPLTLDAEADAKVEHVTIEYWGLTIPEGIWGWYGNETMQGSGYDVDAIAVGNNTYKAIRIISSEYNLFYSVWCTNESEFYDLMNDPFQMRNLLSDEYASLAEDFRLGDRPLSHAAERLDALMMVLKSCKGDSCVHPWKYLHPEGDVSNLLQSLADKYDSFYAKQPKVSYTRCELGYILDAEGPQDFNVYGAVRLAEWVTCLTARPGRSG